VDATVIAVAVRRGARVVTGDAADLSRLAAAAGTRLEIITL
jgi:hypothetical protein